MTAKHAVADDVLGKVSRKMWELQRRLLEGTLDPSLIERELQNIIEGGGSILPIEELIYVLSGKEYIVNVPQDMDVKRKD